MDISFHSMSKKGDIKYLLRKVSQLTPQEPISIRTASNFFSTPEIIAPCAGLLDFLKDHGHEVKINYQGNMLSSSGLNHPYTVQDNSYELLSPMYKVWKFSSGTEVSKIVSAYVQYLNTKAECAKGVIEAFEWTTNEVMDNVLQHSKSEFGYVCCTVTKNAHISFAVYDNGIGILRSFQGSGYRFRNPYDAITSAMKKGFTRDKANNQGNGLWGMSQLILSNKGLLNIISSEAIVGYNNQAELYKNEFQGTWIDKRSLLGTLVDFQFQCNNEVSIVEVFGGGYTYANLYIESFEDEKNRIQLKVSDLSFGYTTRDSGERARTLAINLVTQTDAKEPILIDFDGIGIISSSFADEFIAKLICHYGYVKFNSLFRIVNLKETNAAIINHAIMQRVSTEFSNNAN